MKDGVVIEEGLTKEVLDKPKNIYTKQLVQSGI